MNIIDYAPQSLSTMFFKRTKTTTPETRTGGGQGFIFATTGRDYTTLARRAARNLRLTMPSVQVDLFTDQPISDSVFDQIHQLSHKGKRPKMEALSRSRFEKTIYLDADVLVLEDISDVFDLLDISPVAGALGVSQSRVEMKSYRTDIPHGFPVINAGVLGLKRCPETERFIEAWIEAYDTSGRMKDQPTLRAVLYEHKLVPLILPASYNLLKLSHIRTWRPLNGAVRCLHVRALHDVVHENPEDPISLHEVVDQSDYNKLLRARGGDHDVSETSAVYELPAPKRTAQEA